MARQQINKHTYNFTDIHFRNGSGQKLHETPSLSVKKIKTFVYTNDPGAQKYPTPGTVCTVDLWTFYCQSKEAV